VMIVVGGPSLRRRPPRSSSSSFTMMNEEGVDRSSGDDQNIGMLCIEGKNIALLDGRIYRVIKG